MRGEEARPDSASLLVTGGDEAAAVADFESNVIGVTYERDAEGWLSEWGEDADRAVVVSVGERSRGSARATAGEDGVETEAGAVETVPSESAVGEVGALLHEYLSAWEDQSTTVCVDGLAPVLDAVPAETAFRFVHAVLARAGAEDAVVVAMDDDAYPPHVVDTFAELFGDVR